MERQILLHYRIVKKLGEGGMGSVYLAEDTKLDRKVALKLLPEALGKSPEYVERFRTEARAAAALNHPNIATLYSVEEADGQMFLTMEYVEGQPLGRLIASDGLPLQQFFRWMIPIADGFCRAHEKGILHRDIKPDNVLISTEGIPKILDFGLARIDRPQLAGDAG